MNFQAIFNQESEVQASAPGRINLLGEHTDYNDGFVLPTAIPQRTIVELAVNSDRYHHFYSENLDEQVNFSPDTAPPTGFASYIYGCLEVLKQQAYNIPPLNIYIKSSVPIGSGLSSSAALEVATLRALRQLLDLQFDDITIAKLAQQAEINYAGVQCGIMDQMASSLADTEHLLFLDTRNLESQLLFLPSGTEILAIDSGIPRHLASSGYNQRRHECEEAARLLNVKALRDITSTDKLENLPEPYKKRARHVITENNRVLEVLQNLTPKRFGALMNASHASLRDNYEVSVPPLDLLVNILQQHPEVFGARLTGAGFGGATVALVAQGKALDVATDTRKQYQNAGYSGQILIPA